MSHVSGNSKLIQVIQEKIRNSAQEYISFYEYMNCCLYHSEFGYYLSEKIKVGREGDFYTSSSIGGVMGELLAARFVKRMNPFDDQVPLCLVEWGGGNGQLAMQVLDEIRILSDDVYKRTQYISVEASPFHRSLQADRLAGHADKLSFMTPDELKNYSPDGYVGLWANELLDAFPVHRLLFENGTYYELGVKWDETSGFEEIVMPLHDEDIWKFIESEKLKPQDGQRFEYNPGAGVWIQSMTSWLNNGEMVILDYGAETDELLAPHRMNGTLLCYRNHVASDRPYEYIGEQDMTSHVDFTVCRKAAKGASADEVKLLTQKEFLVGEGILERLQSHYGLDPFSPAAKKNRAIRQLLLSDGMSELFKVLIINKEKR